MNNFVTFSHLPLRIASYGGAALAFASFAYLLFVVFGYFTGQIQSPGYTSLMSVILLACGIQLLILGALGEYIGRIYEEVKRRPLYLVSEERNVGTSAGGWVRSRSPWRPRRRPSASWSTTRRSCGLAT